MNRERAPRRWRLGRVVAAGVVLLQLLGGLGTPAARAEGFAEAAFEQQWRATDEAVLRGTVSRTYFWGPAPFGHTNEVYAEAPNGLQRRVQYFDKARMELTRRPGQDPNLVTNGLLTVELVSGQMQVGDSRFLRRSPATNPVAGDPLQNDQTPTYASFNAGRLAYGVQGAVASPDRTGQPIMEAVNKAGQVSALSQAPKEARYAGYFGETGHNIADVFLTFFRAAPLGDNAWLPVMGYPITEPFWARERVTVAGQPRDVLIQLFERRAVTYTPANPSGFQVEMGNIGQHYFGWRYGLDVRDRLPPNDRLIHAEGRSLVSTSIRRTLPTLELGDAPAAITRVWALNEGRAVVATAGGPYLADLTRARAFRALGVPAGLQQAEIEAVSASGDGRRIAILFHSGPANRSVIQVYDMGNLASDNLQVTGEFTAYASNESGLFRMSLSRDGAYLAAPVGRAVTLVDLASRATRTVMIDERASITSADWIGGSSRLLVTAGGFDSFDPATGKSSNTPGRVAQVDAASGVVRQMLAGPHLREARVSPDGNYFALRSYRGTFNPDSTATFAPTVVSFRSLTEPAVELAPPYEQGTSGRSNYEGRLAGWSADGSYVLVHTFTGGTAGAQSHDFNLISIVTGRPIQENNLSGGTMSSYQLRLVGPFYTLTTSHLYNGPERPSYQTIALRNVDGSEARELRNREVAPNVEGNDLPIRTAQVVQVVAP